MAQLGNGRYGNSYFGSIAAASGLYKSLEQKLYTKLDGGLSLSITCELSYDDTDAYAEYFGYIYRDNENTAYSYTSGAAPTASEVYPLTTFMDLDVFLQTDSSSSLESIFENQIAVIYCTPIATEKKLQCVLTYKTSDSNIQGIISYSYTLYMHTLDKTRSPEVSDIIVSGADQTKYAKAGSCKIQLDALGLPADEYTILPILADHYYREYVSVYNKVGNEYIPLTMNRDIFMLTAEDTNSNAQFISHNILPYISDFANTAQDNCRFLECRFRLYSPNGEMPLDYKKVTYSIQEYNNAGIYTTIVQPTQCKSSYVRASLNVGAKKAIRIILNIESGSILSADGTIPTLCIGDINFRSTTSYAAQRELLVPHFSIVAYDDNKKGTNYCGTAISNQMPDTKFNTYSISKITIGDQQVIPSELTLPTESTLKKLYGNKFIYRNADDLYVQCPDDVAQWPISYMTKNSTCYIIDPGSSSHAISNSFAPQLNNAKQYAMHIINYQNSVRLTVNEGIDNLNGTLFNMTYNASNNTWKYGAVDKALSACIIKDIDVIYEGLPRGNGDQVKIVSMLKRYNLNLASKFSEDYDENGECVLATDITLSSVPAISNAMNGTLRHNVRITPNSISTNGIVAPDDRIYIADRYLSGSDYIIALATNYSEKKYKNEYAIEQISTLPDKQCSIGAPYEYVHEGTIKGDLTINCDNKYITTQIIDIDDNTRKIIADVDRLNPRKYWKPSINPGAYYMNRDAYWLYNNKEHITIGSTDIPIVSGCEFKNDFTVLYPNVKNIIKNPRMESSLNYTTTFTDDFKDKTTIYGIDIYGESDFLRTLTNNRSIIYHNVKRHSKEMYQVQAVISSQQSDEYGIIVAYDTEIGYYKFVYSPQLQKVSICFVDTNSIVQTISEFQCYNNGDQYDIFKIIVHEESMSCYFNDINVFSIAQNKVLYGSIGAIKDYSNYFVEFDADNDSVLITNSRFVKNTPVKFKGLGEDILPNGIDDAQTYYLLPLNDGVYRLKTNVVTDDYINIQDSGEGEYVVQAGLEEVIGIYESIPIDVDVHVAENSSIVISDKTIYFQYISSLLEESIPYIDLSLNKNYISAGSDTLFLQYRAAVSEGMELCEPSISIINTTGTIIDITNNVDSGITVDKHSIEHNDYMEYMYNIRFADSINLYFGEEDSFMRIMPGDPTPIKLSNICLFDIGHGYGNILPYIDEQNVEPYVSIPFPMLSDNTNVESGCFYFKGRFNQNISASEHCFKLISEDRKLEIGVGLNAFLSYLNDTSLSDVVISTDFSPENYNYTYEVFYRYSISSNQLSEGVKIIKHFVDEQGNDQTAVYHTSSADHSLEEPIALSAAYSHIVFPQLYMDLEMIGWGSYSVDEFSVVKTLPIKHQSLIDGMRSILFKPKPFTPIILEDENGDPYDSYLQSLPYIELKIPFDDIVTGYYKLKENNIVAANVYLDGNKLDSQLIGNVIHVEDFPYEDFGEVVCHLYKNRTYYLTKEEDYCKMVLGAIPSSELNLYYESDIEDNDPTRLIESVELNPAINNHNIGFLDVVSKSRDVVELKILTSYPTYDNDYTRDYFIIIEFYDKHGYLVEPDMNALKLTCPYAESLSGGDANGIRWESNGTWSTELVGLESRYGKRKFKIYIQDFCSSTSIQQSNEYYIYPITITAEYYDISTSISIVGKFHK